MKYYAGIDVGGTKIYTVIIDEEGCILSRVKVKTGKDTSFKPVFDNILHCYQAACQDAKISEEKIQAVGLAVPSSIDYARKFIKHAPNLGWINIAFGDLMKAQFGKPGFIDNDVNMGVFGEYHLGVAKGYTSVYGMFVGTGIGGGYIHNGRIVRGVNYTASEVGHHIIKINGPRCNCGNRGCLEAIAAKVGMIRYMQKLVEKKRKKTVLDKIAPNWRKGVGSSALRKAFKKDDDVVIRALHRSAEAIGIAAANLITLVGTNAIILGGGVITELGDVLLPLIEQSMRKHTFANGAEGVPLLQSTLGDDAVALGAAWFVRLPEKQEQLFV
jgi:glucokinase